MLGVLLGLVFLWKRSHMFPSCYGGKYLKEGGRMKQAHVLYPLWLFPPPRVLSSLNLFARPSGFLYLQIVALHWDACFFEVDCSLNSESTFHPGPPACNANIFQGSVAWFQQIQTILHNGAKFIPCFFLPDWHMLWTLPVQLVGCCWQKCRRKVS